MYTQTTVEQTEPTTPAKIKKLKLNPFDSVYPRAVAVCIQAVEYYDTGLNEDIETYGASLVLFVSAKKTVDHPLVIHLNLTNDCPHCLAYEALGVAMVMGGEVLDLVLIHDIDGEIEEECSAKEILETFNAAYIESESSQST